MSELKKGVYQPVYYLMGEEGYYTDKITDYIIEHSLTEVERDFNLTVYYGLESDIDTIITAAKRFPMMAERQVIVVREAQLLIFHLLGVEHHSFALKFCCHFLALVD